MIRLFRFFLLISCGFVHSQELNCTITLNTQRLSNANQQIFKTLETSLNEFVNQTSWTNHAFKQNEKINCSMYINLSSNNSDQFSGTIQVQSSRPVYNSTYSTPVLNINDKDFNFRYTQFENLIFNPAEFQSNLVSVISFYCYMILGMDADTFVPKGGDSYFEIAQNISNVAQQSGNKGWNQSDGLQSRYFFVNDMVSPTYIDLRQSSFMYHSGLDLMSSNLKEAKEKLRLSIVNIGKLNAVKPNSYLVRVFFDAKSDEITSIFSAGPSIPLTDLTNVLNRSSPLNSSKWSLIKN